MPSGVRFCPECGTRLDPADPAPAPPGRAQVSLSRTVAHARLRAGYSFEAWSLHWHASRQLNRLQRQIRRALVERRDLVLALGDAVYRGDGPGTERLRAEVHALDDWVAEREREMAGVAADVRERLERASLAVQPTLVEVPEPGPAVVPEPYPPPGEANPPEPAIVPEPSPPPDELTPPEPPAIPEPSPKGRSRSSRKKT